MQDGAVADVTIFIDQHDPSRKAVNDAIILDVGAGVHDQPAVITPQRRPGSDVASDPDHDVAD